MTSPTQNGGPTKAAELNLGAKNDKAYEQGKKVFTRKGLCGARQEEIPD
jgi:hypothetical protein